MSSQAAGQGRRQDSEHIARKNPTQLDIDVVNDGEMLVEVITLLKTKAPLAGWPPKVLAALGEAIGTETKDPCEREKAARLERHLFVGAAPGEVMSTKGTPSREADRLRADLADLMPYGAGLHLAGSVP